MWPLPPRYLLGRVVGEESDEDLFCKGGLIDWRTIRRKMVAEGFPFDGGTKVLDFGVGCGRILRYFGIDGAACEFVGADVDEDAISWNRQHLDFAQFERLPFSPPTPFRDAEFAAIYAFSVFSHLPEERHLAWLQELHRISRPGAVLVITVMGLHCARLVKDGLREFAHPKSTAMQAAFSLLEAGEFLFFPYRRLTFAHQENQDHFDKWDLRDYGSTYVPEAYIQRRWKSWFDVVSWQAAPNGWQDYVVLRRRVK
jgi:SAM-dependent methyltransferase